MSNKKSQLTQKQYDELLERKSFIEETEIPNNSLEIERAKEFGDLSENAEYQAAKDYQEKIIAELNEITHKLNNSVLIKANKDLNSISVGHTVSVKFNNEETLTFLLVGENGNGIDEVDVESKLGANVLGKSKGDGFEYEANNPSLGVIKGVISKISG